MLEGHESLDALRSAFADVFPKAVLIRSTDLDALHQRVDAVVDALKAAGEPPERVIRWVKDLASDIDGASEASAHRLVNRAVEWAIARYFDSDGPPV
jgi:hypothetical protein